MKRLFLSVLLCTPFLLAAQAIDTLAIEKQVDSLIQVSRALTGKQEFDKALEVNAIAEKMVLETLGRESAAYGSCCFNRGRVLYFKGDYPECEIWYMEALTIREKMLGKEHTDYILSLTNLGSLYKLTGKYEKSELFYLEALSICQKILGKENPYYVFTLTEFAGLCFKIGSYEKAESLYIEVSLIFKKVLGTEHRDYASSINNIANFILK